MKLVQAPGVDFKPMTPITTLTTTTAATATPTTTATTTPAGAMSNFATPSLAFFADLTMLLGAPQEVGHTEQGFTQIIPIIGGTATAVGWTAQVLGGGANFQLVVSERVAQLDARCCLQMDGGDLVYVHNRAVRSGPPQIMARLLRGEALDEASSAQIYFRCAPTFETASPALA